MVLWDWNLDTGQIYVSPRIVELLDLDADGDGHISSEYWSTRIHPDDLPVFQDAIRAHLRGETEFYTCEFRALNPAGEYIWISHRAAAADRCDRVALRGVRFLRRRRPGRPVQQPL